MTDSAPRGRAARMQVPVTNVERHLDPKRPIVTRTDLKGRITYANPAFVEISGFTEDELIGQPHNVVRHPDMPREAFADLWRTIAAGVPWRGRVKNRSKNGDYYWVDAYVSKLTENGEKVGYMSVRARPTEQDKSAAETLYAQVRAGKARMPATRISFGRSLLLDTGLAFAAMTLLAAAGALLPAPWSYWTAGGAALVAVAAFAWLAVSLRQPIERIKRELCELAEANLSTSDAFESCKEFSDVQTALQSMKVNLRALMSDVVSAANDVDRRCAQLSSDTSATIGRFGTQAEGISSVAAALQELSVSVSEISEATERSTEHAGRAIAVVAQGEQQMNQSLAATRDAVRSVESAQTRIMQLENAVASISAVTQVIQSIAEQTNLLALNAAIEAARAGEQGRGFAVVADEVRKLAERTRVSTVDIAAKVGEIQTGTGAVVGAMREATAGVTEGALRIEATGESLRAIAEASRGVEASAREIASMLVQQKQASHEVAGTMERMSGLTDENVGSFNKVTDATLSLAQTASALHRLLDQFERKM